MGKRAAVLPEVAERQRDERLLCERIDAAGELKKQRTAIERQYDQMRAEVAALVKKLYGINEMVLGEVHTAILKYDMERAIDAEGLFRDIEPAVFFELATIPLGVAQHALPTTMVTKHLKERQKTQPTLYIGDRVTEPEAEKPAQPARKKRT